MSAAVHDPIHRSPHVRPTRLLAVAIGVLLVAWCLREDVQPDLYFHLAAGRWILAHGIPHTNVFLAPFPDHPFVDHEWLFQIGAHAAFGLGGAPLLTLLKTLAVAATFGALATACRRGGDAPRLIALTLAIVVAGGRFILRPEVASFLGVAVHLAVLTRAGARPGRSAFLVLPALQAVWGNVHGFALLGPALVGVTLAAAGAHAAVAAAGRRGGAWGRLAARLPGAAPAWRDVGAWAGLLAAEVAASCLNPYGLEVALYPFWVLSRATQDTASAGLSYRVVKRRARSRPS